MSTIPALQAKRRALEIRAACLATIRAFFNERGFLEVETPVRIAAPALEPHLDAEPAGGYYLRTSPELQMKQLLCAGYERIYQLGPCFRQGEQGTWHRPEYTMLEWYRAHADYLDILVDTRALLVAVCQAVHPQPVIHRHQCTWTVDGEWPIHTVRDLYREWAGWDPVADFDADRFDVDWVDRIVPVLEAIPTPVIVTDYPAAAAALARRKPGAPEVAERWELFIAGVELANAYSELTDAGEQASRFAACAQGRQAAGRAVYPLDTDFMQALKAGCPPSGGIALGIDRLVMLLAEAGHIDEVNAFPAPEPKKSS